MIRKTDKNGVTLIEITAIFLLLFLFVTGTIIGGRKYAIPGYLLGGLAFVASLHLFILVIGLVISLIDHLAVGVIPRIPTCRHGKCRKRDYSLVKVSERRWAFRCKCGDVYDKVGRRFVSLGDDGSEIPYLEWKPFRGWRKEDPTTASTTTNEPASGGFI